MSEDLERRLAAARKRVRELSSDHRSDTIHVNSVHPNHSDAPFRQLHHYVLLFHDEMLEALARSIESRLVTGTMGTIMEELAGSLIKQPYRAGLSGGADDSCEVRAQAPDSRWRLADGV